MNHRDDHRGDHRPVQPERTMLTRVVVVPADGSGAQEFWADEFETAYLDAGRTLKLFATGDGSRARAARAAALSEDFARLEKSPAHPPAPGRDSGTADQAGRPDRADQADETDETGKTGHSGKIAVALGAIAGWFL